MGIRFGLTEAQQTALCWAMKLPDGIRPATQACSHMATLLVLERLKLVEVVERDQSGRPVRAVVTALGRRVGGNLRTAVDSRSVGATLSNAHEASASGCRADPRQTGAQT